MHRLVVVLILVATSILVPHSSSAQGSLCFNVPGITNCIDGRFREYWEQNGGLAVFGYPITPVTNEQTPDGTFATQYFERNRFELHPEKPRPYDVLLGRLGDLRLQQQGRNWFTFPKGQPNGSCIWTPETGHSVCEPFKSYWESHGLQDPALAPAARSLALFGLPLSEPTMETNATGATVLTQWFERARFEHHPNNPAGSQILLGLLGNETRSTSPQPPAPQPTPTAPPAAPNVCADAPPPVNARIRPSNCVTAGTTIYFDIFGFKPNEDVGFWLTAPDGSRVGTVQTYNIGPTGSIDNFEFSTRGADPGIWFFVFQGTDSGHQSIIYIKVLLPGSTPPPTSPPPSNPPPAQPSPTPRPQPTPTAPPARNCHPSYPDFCIPPPPPDLDCPDIGRKNFTVRQPDPHRLDADKDGIGCED